MSSIFHSSISPEIELILLCSRPVIDSSTAVRARELVQNGINWQKLVKRAHSWLVLPLVSRGLQFIGTSMVPRATWDHIQALNFAAARWNLFLTAELVSLLEGLAARDIPVIPYKGPVLAQSLYGNLALRPFGDLDIITRKQDVHRARDILISSGYHMIWPQMPLTGAQDAAHLAAKYNYKLERPEDQVAVELHWGISPRYFSIPRDPEWLWARLEPLSLGGQSLMTFSTEDYVLILSVHGANHCWLYRLNRICDLAELIVRNQALDWDYVLREARSLDIQRMLSLGLLIAHDLLGSELPAEVWEVVNEDETARSLADKTIDHFTQPNGGALGAFYIPRYQIDVRQRLLDKVRYALFMSEPSVKDWTTLPLPAPFAFIYYLLRPIRLLIEHGWTPINHRLRS